MKKSFALILAIIMVFSVCGTAFAAHTTNEVTELEAMNSDTSEYIAEQSYVLLENNGVLPIAKSGSIALFGSAAEYTIKGGTGSGDVNQRSRDHIGQAFEAAGYEIADPTWFAKMAAQPVGSGCMGASPKNDMEITDDELAEAAANTDTAIYAIARNAGEGSDRNVNSGNGSYMLNATELANIAKICDAFENVIVVYNTCVMDTSWQADFDIDAVVYMGNGGQRGSEALVNVLNGTTTPSGKLTDTWPVDFYDYPSAYDFGSQDGNTNTEWYTDGIYVGYRYFDTFGKEVKYEFGYGLSYTDFQIDVKSVEADGENVTVKVAVTNIGDTYSGKEVVEVYFSAPDGILEKPYQELAAYGKTDELQPGETQILTISFATTDMSSYDEDQAAYIMEAGDYIVRVGNSSRNTVAAAKIVLDETAVTEQLSNQMTLEPGAVLDLLSKADATPIANNDAEELQNAPVIKLAAADLPYENNASTNDEETITTYLFAEDAADYTARDEITLQTNTIAGVIDNAANPSGSNNTFNGYRTTTYAEVVEVVDPLPEGITKETAKLTDVLNGDISMKQFIACLSVDELARLCVGGAGTIIETPDGNQVGAAATSVQGGAGQTTSQFIETRHIPSMPNADGPAGVRITQHYTTYVDQNGRTYSNVRLVDGVWYQVSGGGWGQPERLTPLDESIEITQTDYYQFCTAFPVGTNIAQTWDAAVIESFGYAYGSEMKDYGVTTCLCPGMNIHRNALCGRNFEYYSEDPLVTGITAAYFTKGVQTHAGIGVTLKHFYANNQENNRNAVNNVISERASREIYLKGFEIAVKLAQPMCVMDCYQENNGWSGSNDWDKDEDILRGEWGFKGYVMTDWGGGRSLPYFGKHAGCDIVMPGGNPSVILNGYNVTAPTFNADGTIRNAGDFIVGAGGSVSYTTPTDAESEEALAESLKAAIAAEEARYDKIGSDATITWYGELNMYNKICLGDLQKSAERILNVALQSQDMEILMAALGEELEVGSYSANNGAPLTEGWTQAEKGDVTNSAIVAEKITVDSAEVDTAEVKVEYKGDAELTTVRLYVDSALPIAEIISENDFEYNEADGRIIVYKGDGSVIDNELFTIVYEFDGLAADGEYPVDLTLIEATGADAEIIDAVTIDGAVIIDNTYAKGDVTQDGSVDNRDLIMIARYLVGLVEFNEKQLEAADYNDDGLVNNSDLVLIARAIVAAA